MTEIVFEKHIDKWHSQIIAADKGGAVTIHIEMPTNQSVGLGTTMDIWQNINPPTLKWALMGQPSIISVKEMTIPIPQGACIMLGIPIKPSKAYMIGNLTEPKKKAVKGKVNP